MADLTAKEKRKIETLLEMGSGYVLDFSNRTFRDFVLDTTLVSPLTTLDKKPPI